MYTDIDINILRILTVSIDCLGLTAASRYRVFSPLGKRMADLSFGKRDMEEEFPDLSYGKRSQWISKAWSGKRMADLSFGKRSRGDGEWYVKRMADLSYGR